jgi:ubiquinone/menaquinone biosynthesis C-methylase UbiE
MTPLASIVDLYLKFKWKWRHLKKGDDFGNKKGDWVIGYKNSISHPHRAILLDKIMTASPQSVLEFGSNCGVNLYALYKMNPKMELSGIDINLQSIEYGKKYFKNRGISAITLSSGDEQFLEGIDDGRYDLVFTSSVLRYISPAKIEDVLRHLYRISKRTIILWEPVSTNQTKSELIGLEWHHNFSHLIDRIIAKDDEYTDEKIIDEGVNLHITTIVKK